MATRGDGESGGDKLSTLTAVGLFAALGVGGMLSGFSASVASARRRSPKSFDQGREPATRLALRALGWGSAFAVGGTGLVSLAVWGALSVWGKATPRRLQDEVITQPMTSQR